MFGYQRKKEEINKLQMYEEYVWGIESVDGHVMMG